MPEHELVAGGRPEKLAALRTHYDKWYADFDWQAMEVALCAILAHYAARDTQPIWPFIVGAPRTGKTEVIRALEGLPKAESIGDLTPTSLISGHRDADGGLLHQMSKEGKSILLFKDFTTILSKREEMRNEVISILREVADGDFNRWTGVGKAPPWSGHLTIVAAVTHEIERTWSVMQALGPRFLFIRWPTPRTGASAEMAMSHLSHESEIKLTAQRLVREIFYECGQLYFAADNLTHRAYLIELCELFVLMRRFVQWNSAHTEIIEVREAEGAGSIAKHLNLIARMRASLYGRPRAEAEDMALAQRVALDSCPELRMRIARHLAAHPAGMYVKDLACALDVSRKSAQRKCEELEAMCVVSIDEEDPGGKVASLTGAFYDKFCHILTRNGP